jgi:hypothetical protein
LATAIIALREAAPAGPFLIVCPAGVRLTRRREIRLVEPYADIHVIQSARDWSPDRRWTVVNYGVLGTLDARGTTMHRRARNCRRCVVSKSCSPSSLHCEIEGSDLREQLGVEQTGAYGRGIAQLVSTDGEHARPALDAVAQSKP